MRLDFIPLDKLSIDRTNMRHGRKTPDLGDLLPTVRKRGILQTLLVRPGAEAGRFEIVAGRRRYHAACIVAAERRAAANDNDTPDPDDTMLPCAILDAGDDADAVEASMIENMARLDADEVSQWDGFTRLVKEGKTVEDIGLTFGLPELSVRRVLALGNLLPRIRELYRRDEVDRVTVRHLTLASKSQQRAWLALLDDPEARAPAGHQLKSWLFGGQSIPARHALFDVEASGLAVVADLFGEDRYFADADAFWIAQNAAIEARRAAFLEAGWVDAVIVPAGESFSSWQYEKTPKRKGGRVYLDVRASGEVVVHEGYLSRKEAARAAKAGGAGAGAADKPVRSEVTAAMQDYIDLHRHAAVRATLTAHPSAALRLMVAHAVCGSCLWRVDPDPQASRNDAVRESVAGCAAQVQFEARRGAVLALLGLPADKTRLTGGHGHDRGIAGIFRRLLDLPDAAVMDVIAIVTGETLARGSAAVEAAALHIGMDMAGFWQAEPLFLDLIRDKQVLVAMIADLAGPEVAKANAAEKTATLRQIVRDCLDGTNGRAKAEHWVPRWLAFPPSAYTERGGVGAVRAHAAAIAALAGPPNEPGAPEPDIGAGVGPCPDAETDAEAVSDGGDAPDCDVPSDTVPDLDAATEDREEHAVDAGSGEAPERDPDWLAA